MSDPLKDLEDLLKQYNVPKPPIAAVLRPDIYERVLQEFSPARDGKFPIPFGLPVFADPAADSVAMRQTEECAMFYDHKALELYLNRGKDAITWVRYCCEQAGIPYPLDDEPFLPRFDP